VIYFNQDVITKNIKIGYTGNSAESRRRDLQTGCPGKLTTLVVIEGTEEDEKHWKARFAKDKLDPSIAGGKEWFKPSAELLLAIAEIKIRQLEAEKDRLLDELHEINQRIGSVCSQVDRDVWYKLVGWNPSPFKGPGPKIIPWEQAGWGGVAGARPARSGKDGSAAEGVEMSGGPTPQQGERP
jgi:hypothetical protein